MSQKTLSEDIREYHEVIVQALIDAKQKENKAEKALVKAGLFFILVLVIGCGYLVYKLMLGSSGTSYLTFILSDYLILIWILVLFITYRIFEMKNKKFEKAEKDFDELKEDVIDRSSDIWNSSELEQKRLSQYQDLKKNYDINLYYK